MKKIILVLILALSVSGLFAKTEWIDLTEEQKEAGYTAIAYTDTKEEVLKITHVKDLEPYFKTYQKVDYENDSNKTIYIVVFFSLGVNVMEIAPHSNVAAMYIKTIFN